jgi:formamidopyrimidine-DNA glycosylase
MPELPEVETVRRMLEQHVTGRRIARALTSAKPLRFPLTRGWKTRVEGRAIVALRRHGKYLLIDLDGGLTLLSHLGMSGRWLFFEEPPLKRMAHVHVRLRFEDGSELWFQDARRFGMLELHSTHRVHEAPLLAVLGPDPFPEPPAAETFAALGRGRTASVKVFLMDQRHVAGIGNIYASEILFRAGVHPARATGRVRADEWLAIRDEMRDVLAEAVERFGTTFSLYRTLWNEPGTYAERLFVYDRAGDPCRRCGGEIRHMVQGQRSTYWCPACQPKRRARAVRAPGRRAPAPRKSKTPGSPPSSPAGLQRKLADR